MIPCQDVMSARIEIVWFESFANVPRGVYISQVVYVDGVPYFSNCCSTKFILLPNETGHFQKLS